MTDPAEREIESVWSEAARSDPQRRAHEIIEETERYTEAAQKFFESKRGMTMGELIKTKTFWSGVGLIVTGIAHAAGLVAPEVAQTIEIVIGGLAAIFVRSAITKAGK